MEDSILKSTKKLLGVDPSYTAFDLDIILDINLAFSVLSQLGIGPDGGFAIGDDQATWSSLGLPTAMLSMVKTYVGLKARMLFDPPTTSFLIDAMESQIAEHEGRLSAARETALMEEREEVGA